MKLSARRDIYIILFYLLFILILFDILFNQIISGFAKESWGVTEWLINYQGGFVRRGLAGEVLFQLNNYLELSPYYSILIFCIVTYIILIVFFVKSFLRKGYPIFLLPFAFFLGAPILGGDSGFWLRKDILLILILILSVYLSQKKPKGNLILLNLVFITGLLIHETIGFFGFPILLLILFNKHYNVSRNSIKSIAVTALQLSPSILTFFLCIYYKGSFSIANMIWDSWKSIDFPFHSDSNGVPIGINNYQIPAAINGLSWSLKQGLFFSYDTLRNFSDGIYAPIAWFIIILMVYIVLTNIERTNIKPFNKLNSSRLSKTNISNVLIFQFIFIIPLFILGWDYGRWIFFWVTSSFSVIILVPNEKLALIFPKCITKTGLIINNIVDSIVGKSKEIIFLIALLIGIPSFSWAMRLYLDTNPIVIVLRSISKLLEIN